jgi:hypothetical protein
LAAKLLKYYWFRLEDAMLPVATALMLTRQVVVAYLRRPSVGAWLLLMSVAVTGFGLADICYQRSQLRLSGSFLQPKPLAVAPGVELDPENHLAPREVFHYWLAATQWIRDNTPTEARFLTPRRQQTFKWYAERPEVANWKDVPQDAAALVDWKKAMDEIYPRSTGRFDLAAHNEAELLRLAEKYDADYLLLDRRRAGRPLSWPRVYPMFDEENPAYEVYRVPKGAK